MLLYIIRMFGFKNFIDYIHSILKINFITFIIINLNIITGIIISFITNNIWYNAYQYIFLVFLCFIDLFTALIRSIILRKNIKYKFQSHKLLRTIGKIITYTIILLIFFNIDLYLINEFKKIQKLYTIYNFYQIVPLGVFSILISTEVTSIIENLNDAKLLPPVFYKTYNALYNLYINKFIKFFIKNDIKFNNTNKIRNRKK